MDESLIEYSVLSHISELRQTLLKVLFTLLAGIIFSFIFYQEIFDTLTLPLNQTLKNENLVVSEVKQHRVNNNTNRDQTYTFQEVPTILANSQDVKKIDSQNYRIPPNNFIEFSEVVKPTANLVILSPLEGMISIFKISFWSGIVLTSPLWIFFFIQFIYPALYQPERQILMPFIVVSLLFLLGGGSFAFFLTIPLANEYFSLFNQGIGENLWVLSQYVDYSIILILSNAFAFEFIALLFFAVHLGLISAKKMKEKRRHMIVAAFIIGAILTPPDVLTQLMLAIPLIIFYEVIILYALLREKFRARNNASCVLS